MQSADNSIWAGSNCSGTIRIKDNSIKLYSKSEEIASSCIWSLYQPPNSDKLYLGSYGEGIIVYKDGFFSRFDKNNSFKEGIIFAMLEDSYQNFWVGTICGLYRFNKKNNTHTVYNTLNGLVGNRITSIVEDFDGSIWVSTSTGLSHIKNGKIANYSFGKNKTANHIRSILIEKEKLWLSTYGGGIIFFDRKEYKIITKQDGLYDNFVHTIVPDAKGNFWMSTNNGLFRVAKNDLLKFVNGQINMFSSFSYTKKDGIKNDEFNGGMQPSYCKLDDGAILFPTLDGIVAVDINNLKQNNIPPIIHIEDFIVDDTIFISDKNTVVHSNYNEIKINYSAIDFSSPENLQFQYILEGLNDNWGSLKTDRSVTYQHLPAGKYNFKIRAINADGIWNEMDASYKFKIEAKFYEMFVFKAIVAIILFILIYLIIRIRNMAQHKRALLLEETVRIRTREEREQREKAEILNQEKTELMRIVTHNLKNPLGSVRNSSEYILENSNDSNTVFEMAKIIKYSVNHMLESISQLLFSSEIEEEQFVINRTSFNFEEIVEEIMENNQILSIRKNQKILMINNASNYMKIYADYDKIGAAIDNYICNAIKYSQPESTINVVISDLGEEIKFAVVDNGPGLNKDDIERAFGKFVTLSPRPTANETSTGLGLSIVKKVIELHQGKVGINSELGKGSEFYFVIPK